MEAGAEYDKGRLHGKRYFRELMEGLDCVPESVINLLWTNEEGLRVFEFNQGLLVERLESHPTLAKKASSYCGLCGDYSASAGKVKRMPLSKERNPHLQTILVEAAKMAPRWDPQLAAVYEREIGAGKNRNEATVAVARKLASHLLCVDKSGKVFVPRA
jgi:hypothetical protein